MKNLLFLLLPLLFLACQSQELPFGIAADYLPKSDLITQGIVNKYYIHYKKKDSHDTATDIRYDSYQLTDNKLVQHFYNPASELQIRKAFSFDNNQMRLVKEQRYYRNDTFTVDIAKQVIIDWQQPISSSEKMIQFDWGFRKWETQQQSIKDTTVLNKPAKIFTGLLNYTQLYQGDTVRNEGIYKEIYVQDLGLFSWALEDKESYSSMELIEQIPLADFQKKAKHNRKRIAYINPEETLDKGTSFKPCGKNNYIYDYYNGQGDYHYKGGKKEIWKIIKAQLDTEKLFKESGYLTFRFVVNCEGKAGYFITEQAGLDFQKKAFNPKTVQHLYEITTTLTDWNPTQIRKEAVDAYFYLTFKLKDGELIDLLP